MNNEEIYLHKMATIHKKIIAVFKENNISYEHAIGVLTSVFFDLLSAMDVEEAEIKNILGNLENQYSKFLQLARKGAK